MDISLVHWLRSIKRTKKKERKENRPISSHLDLKLVNNANRIWMRMSKNKPAKNHGITKALANEDTPYE